MGYVAPVNALDVSNANTPLVHRPHNPDGQTPAYRAVAKLGQDGHLASPRQTHTAETTAGLPF